jgi:hypothetical protein
MNIKGVGSKELFSNFITAALKIGKANPENDAIYESNYKELLSRLEQGEKSEKSAIEWAKRAGQNQNQIEKLADEIESLKCCGNCDLYSITNRDCPDYYRVNANSYCDKWQSDGMTRADRIK